MPRTRSLDVPDVWAEGYGFRRYGFGKHEKEAPFRRSALPTALYKPFIRANTQRQISALVVDMDTLDWEHELDMASRDGLPLPNVAVRNDATGNAHLIYLMKRPFDATNPQADFVARRIREALTTALWGADPAFTNYATRSPFASGHTANWMNESLHDGYDLIDALDVDLKTRAGRGAPRRDVVLPDLAEVGGRNCWMNSALARIGAREQRKHHTLASHSDAMERIANHYNDNYLPETYGVAPLGGRELRSIVASSARYTWQFHGDDGDHAEFVEQQVERANRRWDIERRRSTPEEISEAARRAAEYRHQRERRYLPRQVETMASAGRSTSDIVAATGASISTAERARKLAGQTIGFDVRAHARTAAEARWGNKGEAVAEAERLLAAGWPVARVHAWLEGQVSRAHLYRLKGSHNAAK